MPCLVTLTYRNRWIAPLAVGLVVVGLGIVIIASIAIISMRSVINPVEVSGMVRGVRIGSISFINENEPNSTRYSHVARIIGGNYFIVLSGGQSYNVYVGTGQTSPSSRFTLYVPSNVSTLSANFPP